MTTDQTSGTRAYVVVELADSGERRYGPMPFEDACWLSGHMFESRIEEVDRG